MRLDIRTTTRTVRVVPGGKKDPKGHRPPALPATRATEGQALSSFRISRLHRSSFDCVFNYHPVFNLLKIANHIWVSLFSKAANCIRDFQVIPAFPLLELMEAI